MNRPWFQEDNKVDFEAEGYRCAMRRGPVGAWCGYVGIPKSHPWYGKSYTEEVKPSMDMLSQRDPLDHGPIDLLCMVLSNKDPCESLAITLCLRVHGGLTWADNHHACGEPDGLWWFGFDCAHAGDLCPGMFSYPHPGDVYRDQQYVVAEVQSLAAQLARVAS